MSGSDYFRVSVEGNKLCLTVCPPDSDGQATQSSEVLKYLRDNGVLDVSPELVEEICSKAECRPVEISSDASRYVRNAEARLRVSTDKLNVQLEVVPPVWGKHLTHDELEQMLLVNGICYGVKPGVLEDAVKNQQQGGIWLVAEGRPPREGKDGEVEFLIDIEACDCKPAFLEDGSVDFYNIRNIITITKGQPLARLIPPQPGKPGTDVFGSEISAKPVKPARLPRGKNTEINPEEGLLVASCDGHLRLESSGNLSVSQVFEVKGDVDYSVGNIRFNGNIIVNGNVLPNFELTADGDIMVTGYVDAATLKANGNILVSGGIQGRNKGEVQAGGSIFAKFLENVSISAGASIEVGEDIMHSSVFARENVLVKSKRGRIAGGVVRAGKTIVSHNFGSPMGTNTTLEVGIDPLNYEQYRALEQRHNEIKEQYEKVAQLLKSLLQLQKSGALTPSKRDLMKKLLATETHLRASLAECEQGIKELENALQWVIEASVVVNGSIYPGCRIVIGKDMRLVQQTLEKVKFSLSSRREIIHVTL